MTDLEELIRQRQDLLRGRPRTWRDDVREWWRGFALADFIETWATVLSLVALMIAVVLLAIVIADLYLALPECAALN